MLTEPESQASQIPGRRNRLLVLSHVLFFSGLSVVLIAFSVKLVRRDPLTDRSTKQGFEPTSAGQFSDSSLDDYVIEKQRWNQIINHRTTRTSPNAQTESASKDESWFDRFASTASSLDPTYPTGLFEKETDFQAFPRTQVAIVRSTDYQTMLSSIEDIECTHFKLERAWGDLWEDPTALWSFYDETTFDLASTQSIPLDVDTRFAPPFGRLSAMVLECRKRSQIIYKELFHHFEAPLASSSPINVHPKAPNGSVTAHSWSNRWRPPQAWDIRAPAASPVILGSTPLLTVMQKPEWIPIDPSTTDRWPLLVFDIQGSWPIPGDFVNLGELTPSLLSPWLESPLGLLYGIDGLESHLACPELMPLSPDGEVCIPPQMHSTFVMPCIDSLSGGLPDIAMSEGYWTGYVTDLHEDITPFPASRRFSWDVDFRELHSARTLTSISAAPYNAVKDMEDVLAHFRGWPGFVLASLTSNSIETFFNSHHADIYLKEFSIFVLSDTVDGRRSLSTRLGDDLSLRYPHMEALLHEASTQKEPSIQSVYHTLRAIMGRSWPMDPHSVTSLIPTSLPKSAQYLGGPSKATPLPELPPLAEPNIKDAPWPVLAQFHNVYGEKEAAIKFAEFRRAKGAPQRASFRDTLPAWPVPTVRLTRLGGHDGPLSSSAFAGSYLHPGTIWQPSREEISVVGSLGEACMKAAGVDDR